MTLQSATPGSGPTRPRVLVADDDRALRALVEFHFRDAPWEAVFVADGPAAVEAFALAPWDLVLLDLQLPGLHGTEAARAMRRAEAEQGRAPVPILALSAGGPDGPVTPGPDFSGTLPKPFTRQALLDAVGTALRAPAPRAGQGTDPALLHLLPRLYDSVAELAAEAAAGLDRGDLDAAARAGHKMRGATACFGVRPLADAAARLEREALDGNPAAAALALDTLTGLLETSRS
jgi:CheY-like chemotaxis protein